MHHSNTRLRRRTQSVNPRHYTLPKYISISNLDSDLLFEASGFLTSLTPTKLANETPIDLSEKANVL